MFVFFVFAFHVSDGVGRTEACQSVDVAVGITTEFITISNLLKYAGVLETGGQAHEAIEAGVVTLNGVIVTEKRKKVFPQDTVVLDQQVEIKVITE